ncbi:hypothetical protein [Marinibactrum halimedae]|uniref:RamC N-terminal domain-containing protein n=1 Tax=Marinibactrum halimedae TaxID=1444977 RepID=A0AA37T8U6_9GAMM|nr:hypothetical protein [Marinibactrum halimedae]MCD9458833.1 hypothetical protein [Marinibactrum halimedae]GLS27684.1 hypothetical protein GCM10007877_34030 [Marinibactrum halimedae]
MSEFIFARKSHRNKVLKTNWNWVMPDDAVMPDEGWKLHVSANVNNAHQILWQLEDVLFDLDLVFKFIPNKAALAQQNASGTQRGKFLVVYPREIISAFMAVYCIDEKLKKMHIRRSSSPAVPGERAVGDTVIYTRYGGFNNDIVLGPNGNPKKSPRGVISPTWIRDPWNYYQNDGSVNIHKLNTFAKWPKHPAEFHRYG